MGIGWQELLLVALVVMLLFGSAKLPSLMRNLGRSATEFKKGMRDDSDDTDDRTEVRKEDTKIST